MSGDSMAWPILPVPMNVILSKMLEVEVDVEKFARRVVAVAADRSRLASIIMTLNCKVWLVSRLWLLLCLVFLSLDQLEGRRRHYHTYNRDSVYVKSNTTKNVRMNLHGVCAHLHAMPYHKKSTLYLPLGYRRTHT